MMDHASLISVGEPGQGTYRKPEPCQRANCPIRGAVEEWMAWTRSVKCQVTQLDDRLRSSINYFES